MIADILLVAGALGAGFYCFVLARRLARFNDLEHGVGGAVAVLSAQVDDLTKTLQAAQATAGASTSSLEGLTERAESVAKRLELMVASMHDLPDPSQPASKPAETPPTVPPAPASSPAPQPEVAPTASPGPARDTEAAPAAPMFRRHSEPQAGAA